MDISNKSNKDIFYQHQAQTSPYPLGIEIDHAKGVYMYDVNGKSYMDLISGIAVNNLGHGHPKITKAIKDQVDKYLFVMVYGEMVQKPQIDLTKSLLSVLPDTLNATYFVNSGTEANEAALKLAKRYTGRTELVSFNRSYHGNTHGSLSVSGNEVKKNAFRPLLPDVRFIDFNKIEDLQYITEKTAGVIVEPIQGDAGVRIPSIDYMKALRARCTEVGAQLIFDEIQTGFGRTGKFFAFEHFDVVPDILTIAKGMAGGMAMGCFVSSQEKMKVLSHDPILGHITTFGGHPVCCAASNAVINTLKEDKIIEDVERKGQLFEDLLSGHPEIKEIRRKGLMFAIDMESFELVNDVVTTCIENGVITYWFLSTPYAFRIAPPLIISDDEIREACKVILNAIDTCVVNRKKRMES
ncbi:aminotransferase class III-fold pyridoxal phosphate-dependent enzyme [Flammeovirga yaeyamensis]|uniref:Aminotransferase class III-fold pyridoxal phosphate-dependent enzyme n=1 Tax=Flammeovirga yaeyamensis TaxID=367791 RepID=A0AAX1N503_9BACT|nr:aspartate aminotransferase family protein [Flammeovirga yaeyamensis]MBB3700525.1 acetylornithine/succinyldiaminopimelate/putrescine aminotransferase [Flammeovirga yaeyamensis]NMF36854.1 aspartate aminotransferase family protein [Flammeovirga yaeyamensis]QWG02596.1 aminotransferase class III-fold pyridoxal phosphate-dependent enzyme [Flammeovirga yaeyamensis]